LLLGYGKTSISPDMGFVSNVFVTQTRIVST
jgi:hypothetical protein